MFLVVFLENPDTWLSLELLWAPVCVWSVDLQLIHPNEQKRQHHPPRTVSQASLPPSGKSPGLKPPGVGAGGPCDFSISASAVTSGSEKIFASVSVFCEAIRSIDGRVGFGRLCFSSTLWLSMTVDERLDVSSEAVIMEIDVRKTAL